MKTRLYNATKLILISLFVVMHVGCEDNNELPELVASFKQTTNNKTGVVTFTNTSKNAMFYTWDFGDSTNSTEINPVKTFNTGTYRVTLTVENLTGSTATFSESLNIPFKTPLALPITFDDVNVNYQPNLFNGTNFSIINNVFITGSESVISKVGLIKNKGTLNEGLAFNLETPLDATTAKTITLKLWADKPVEVLLKLDLGLGEPLQDVVMHNGNDWQKLTFNLNANTAYSRLSLFIDPKNLTTGTFYVDDIE